ncbi:MAG: hypothetical protein ACLR8B_02890 [Peptoniphilus harei]
MKWQGRRKSSNVSRSKGGGVALGGGGLIIALIVFLITGSPRDAIRSGLGGGAQKTLNRNTNCLIESKLSTIIHQLSWLTPKMLGTKF